MKTIINAKDLEEDAALKCQALLEAVTFHPDYYISGVYRFAAFSILRKASLWYKKIINKIIFNLDIYDETVAEVSVFVSTIDFKPDVTIKMFSTNKQEIDWCESLGVLIEKKLHYSVEFVKRMVSQ